MARGKPAFWSTLLGLPFIIAGVWFYSFQVEYPPDVGIPFAVFGSIIVAIGLYIHYVAAPEKPRLQDGEEIVTRRHPTQRVSVVKIAIGLPLLVATVYLFYFTKVPYVYPTVTFVLGLFTFSTGLYTYWTNTLTNYYVTNNRVIREYRFISLARHELPLSKVRGVQERKSVTESLVGLGNVRVASGGGHSLEIRMRNMEESESFADEIRNVMP